MPLTFSEMAEQRIAARKRMEDLLDAKLVLEDGLERAKNLAAEDSPLAHSHALGSLYGTITIVLHLLGAE